MSNFDGFDRKIVLLSILFGLLVGLIDTVADYLFFYEGDFWHLALFAVPPIELFTRSLLFLCVFTLGLLVSSIAKARKETAREARDLNEKLKHQVGELKHQKRLLEVLIDSLPDNIFVKDTEGRILLNNAAHQHLLGVSTPEESVGKTDFDFFPPELAQAYRADEEIVAEGQSVLDKEERVVDPSGKERWFITHKVPVQDESGRVRQIVGINHDITRRRNLEHQLAQVEKLNAVGQLSSGIAHDFNNILMGIRGHVDFALEDIDSDSSAFRDLEQTRRLIESAANLTAQLLAFSRRQPLQVEVLNVNEVVEKSAQIWGRLIGESIDLRIDLADDLRSVRADRSQLEQILLNLIVNARDAMPDGGVLTIETNNVDLDQDYGDRHPDVTPGEYMVLTVSDSGVGMDKETRSQIFEPFFTTKERSESSGLGLATVYGIVKQHGGNIWAYSEEGIGSTFKVYLPRAETGSE